MLTKICPACGLEFNTKSKQAKFCSPRCRVQAHRNPGIMIEPVTPKGKTTKPATVSTTLADRVKAELEDMEVGEISAVDTSAGQQAIVIAGRIESPHTSDASLAALSKRLSELMTEARGMSRPKSDPLDELKRKRDEKRGVA